MDYMHIMNLYRRQKLSLKLACRSAIFRRATVYDVSHTVNKKGSSISTLKSFYFEYRCVIE